LDLLKRVAQKLEKAGISYMMTGSMALAIYAVPRMTRDIDIIIEASSEDALRIVDLFKDDFYIDPDSVQNAIRHKGMFNIIHNESVIKVDFIVRKDGDFRIEEFSRKKNMNIEGVRVSFVTAEDLILSKLVWAKRTDSELQLRDVRQILNSVKDIDTTYLDKWAKELGVLDILSKANEHE